MVCVKFYDKWTLQQILLKGGFHIHIVLLFQLKLLSTHSGFTKNKSFGRHIILWILLDLYSFLFLLILVLLLHKKFCM